MSKSWDAMMERLGRVEDTVRSEPWKVNRYQPLAQRSDAALRNEMRRLARVTVSVPLGDVLAKEASISHSTFAWSNSYSTGGEDADALEDIVPSLLTLSPQPKNGYTFKYDSGTSKILAYTTAATEVAATTDLASAVGSIDVLVVGQRDDARRAYVSSGGERVVRVSVTVGADYTITASSHWVLQAYARGIGETYGRELGAARSTALAGFTANEPVILYDDARGTELEEGDTVLLNAVADDQGVDGLTEVTLTLVLQRKVT